MACAGSAGFPTPPTTRRTSVPDVTSCQKLALPHGEFKVEDLMRQFSLPGDMSFSGYMNWLATIDESYPMSTRNKYELYNKDKVFLWLYSRSTGSV